VLKFVRKSQHQQIARPQSQRWRAIAELIDVAILHLSRRIDGIAQPQMNLQTATPTS
jgi:hypothetical protein